MSTTDTRIFIEARSVKYAGMSTGGMHLYLVYRDTNGEEYVLRSGPQNSPFPLVGDMKIETNVRMENSADYRPISAAEDRFSKPFDFSDLTDDQAWALMVKYSRMIDTGIPSYELFEENSNAYIGALLRAASANPLDLNMLPRGVEPDEAVGLKYYTDIMRKVAAPADGIVRGTDGADTVSGIQVAEVICAMGGHDTVRAGRGNDQVSGGAGNDKIYGQAGGDMITGGAGMDSMYAGSGDNACDTFVFSQPNETAVGSQRDVIHDFRAHANSGDPAGDIIDLRLIDANTGMDGDQGFAFIGGDAFSGQAGQLRVEAVSGGLLVQGDVNGDAKADFEIQVVGIGALNGFDFLL